ncbi:MAG: hypothetical protein A3C13_00120 [Candidatus Lloydbacteria bacterium RIFCSPHIGHO2_02_FULL_50_11]|nr:MAG: hypothetical protein A3C13_00120 [Candidatus Lloydbacteria bacterium RIFCSPHIGHO2_02_FULL_50_11]
MFVIHETIPNVQNELVATRSIIQRKHCSISVTNLPVGVYRLLMLSVNERRMIVVERRYLEDSLRFWFRT